MAQQTVVATVLLALLASSYAVTAKKARIGNGIRLVGGSGGRGRLEVSSTTGWTLAEGETVSWRPVCAVGGLVDNALAQVMCKLLGYKYGRRYFSSEVDYRPPNATLAARPDLYDPVGYVYCNAKASRRRLDSGDSRQTSDVVERIDASGSTAAAAAAVSATATGPWGDDASGGRSDIESGVDGASAAAHRHRRRGRSLLAPLYGTVDIPANAPYTCTFRLGDCDYSGPLVGIECWKRRMPPAPPPPPSPPSPPPAPPPASLSIRLVGPSSGQQLEPNLCGGAPGTGLCARFNRIELQVPAPPGGSGGRVWAPLCSVPPALLQLVGNVACWQVYNWPRFAHRPDFIVISEPSMIGFPIPQGPVISDNATASPALFDPARFAGWASIASNSSYDTALRLQDLDLKVSSSPCDTGALFAVSCVRRARRS